MKTFINTAFLLISTLLFSQEITGDWNGILDAGGMKLEIGFTINEKEGKLSGHMDVPKQMASKLPLNKVEFNNGELLLQLAMAGIEYTATLKDKTTFEGTFKQAGQKFPLNLNRGKVNVKKPNRPQEPKAPFPYSIEEISFINPIEKNKLSGTLTLPEGKGPFPAAILISGSGQQNRDSEVFGHKPFWVIADYLSRNGIAVLRFDDRGVGDSDGDLEHATSENFADDVIGGIQFLMTRKDIHPKKIGLIGHSEGGMIAPIAASKSKEVAWMVLMAGLGTSGEKVLMDQTELISRASGLSEEQIAVSLKSNNVLYDIIKNVEDLNHRKEQLFMGLKESYDSNPQTAELEEIQKNQLIEVQLNMISSPWFAYFLNYQPEKFLTGFKKPVLVINGTLDLQVPYEANTQGIKQALEKGGNKKVTVTIFEKMNHLFQKSETGNLSEYEEIETTFEPEALEEILSWIKIQTNLK
ncbi:MAG: alpha/beta hydrolase family protein [Flavobacterium sp.]